MPSRVVGYYASWASDYQAKDIPVDLLTHLIYTFAVLDENTLLMKQHDSGMNEARKYKRIVRLKEKKKDLKVLVALGGWNDSQKSTKYSRLVSNSQYRSEFAEHAVTFLRDHGFDGLDIDWEYPKSADKKGFTALLRELRAAFKPHGLLLTAAVSASSDIMFDSYDMPKVAKLVDQIHLMSYDFHIPLGDCGGQVAAHHAPLHRQVGHSSSLCVAGAVDHWLKNDAPKDKIVVGVPAYGISWTLLKEGKNKPGAPVVGPGRRSKHMTYTECTLAHKQGGWRLVKSEGGPYLTRRDQWVSYNDVDTVKEKAEYVLSRGMGGIMVWDITQDDFRNQCGEGRNPLLTAASCTLRKEDFTNFAIPVILGVGAIVLTCCLGIPCC